MRSDAFPHLPTFAERLEWARSYRGIESVTALAKAVGLSKRQLYRFTNEGHTTKWATLEDLARVLAVSPGWLAYGDGVPFPLPTVQAFIQGVEGARLEPDVRRYLEQWPAEFFGTTHPTDAEIGEAVFLIELLLVRARKRGHANQGEQ